MRGPTGAAASTGSADFGGLSWAGLSLAGLALGELPLADLARVVLRVVIPSPQDGNGQGREQFPDRQPLIIAREPGSGHDIFPASGGHPQSCIFPELPVQGRGFALQMPENEPGHGNDEMAASERALEGNEMA